MTMVETPSLKRCPACEDEVKREALICRFCGHDFRESPRNGGSKRWAWVVASMVLLVGLGSTIALTRRSGPETSSSGPAPPTTTETLKERPDEARGRSSQDPEYESVDELVSRLTSQGIQCTGVESNMDNTEGQVQGLANLQDSGHCSIEASFVGISIYRSSALLAAWMEQVRGSEFVSQDQFAGEEGTIPADGRPNLVVYGRKWVVTIDSRPLAQQLEAALGGQVDCLGECA
jgi:hypothetical protein